MTQSLLEIDPTVIRNYRLEVENAYCKAIVEAVDIWREQQRQSQFAPLNEFGRTSRLISLASLRWLQEAEQLVPNALSQERRANLNSQFGRYGISSFSEFIELEVCHRLLCYLHRVIHLHNQGIRLVRQAILEQERLMLDLKPESAKALNEIIDQLVEQEPPISAPDPKELKQKLQQYDQHLFQAIQREGTALSAKTLAELKLLQVVYGIADEEIPAPEVLPLLQSERKINYIRLWRKLKQQQWRAANEETHRCLVKADGRENIEPDLLDMKRIPLVDLQSIDALWRKFSNQRFGFSVQLEVMQKVEQNLEYFGEAVDWRRNNSWINYEFVDFSAKAVPGHLPVFPGIIGWWVWHDGKLRSLLERFAKAQTPEAA